MKSISSILARISEIRSKSEEELASMVKKNNIELERLRRELEEKNKEELIKFKNELINLNMNKLSILKSREDKEFEQFVKRVMKRADKDFFPQFFKEITGVDIK